jgi:hypothetical protein
MFREEFVYAKLFADEMQYALRIRYRLAFQLRADVRGNEIYTAHMFMEEWQQAVCVSEGDHGVPIDIGITTRVAEEQIGNHG